MKPACSTSGPASISPTMIPGISMIVSSVGMKPSTAMPEDSSRTRAAVKVTSDVEP